MHKCVSALVFISYIPPAVLLYFQFRGYFGSKNEQSLHIPEAIESEIL